MEITITQNQDGWYFNDGCDSSRASKPRVLFALGYVIIDNRVVDVDTDAGEQAILRFAVDESLPTLNGSFAACVIFDQGRRLCFLTDAIGTVPLYYSIPDSISIKSDKPSTFSVSCNSTEVVRESGSQEFSQDSISQLLCFGYVLDNKTLFDGIEEVPPATRLCLSLSNKEAEPLSISANRYWVTTHAGELQTQEDFDSAANETIALLEKRYGDYLQARDEPCLIKLTGGTDSRLLLGMLCGQSRLRTATYGHSGNRDVFVAKSLSRQLEVEHTYASLTGQEGLNESDVSLTRNAHGLRASPYIGLGSVAVLKDVPSMSYLHAPGHAADFVAGSHLKPEYFAEHSPQSRTGLIRSAHSLIDSAAKNKDYNSVPLSHWLASEVADQSLLSFANETAETPTWIALHQWNLVNRQRRFVLSDAAVLRQNGPVILPYWDLDFVNLFERTDSKLLKNQLAYKKHAAQYLQKRIGEKLSIDWTFNTTKVSPILKEILASRDRDVAIEGLGQLGSKIASKIIRKKQSNYHDRYVCSFTQEELKTQCKEAFLTDQAIREALTTKGQELVTNRMPGRALEIKSLLDSWRHLLDPSLKKNKKSRKITVPSDECNEVAITDYLYDRLNAYQMTIFRKHLEKCPNCSEKLRLHEATKAKDSDELF